MSDDLDSLLAKLTPEQRSRLAARLRSDDSAGGTRWLVTR
jgi:hypothetical protein